MRAVYEIKDCSGGLFDTIEIDLPAEFDDPGDFEAELYALDHSDHSDPERCGSCGSPSARASFAGFPVEPIWSDITIKGMNRDVMIADLQRIILDLRDMPKEVSFVECNADGGRIG